MASFLFISVSFFVRGLKRLRLRSDARTADQWGVKHHSAPFRIALETTMYCEQSGRGIILCISQHDLVTRFWLIDR
jgi:hypothetical protein